MTPADVTRAALALLDTPFHHQGRVDGVGVDCIGVAVRTAQAIGVEIRDAQRYSAMPSPELLQRLGEQLPQAVGPAPGVLALIRWSSHPQHVAIVIDGHSHPLDLVHAWAGMGRVVRHGFDSSWQRRCVAYFGFPGVAYPPGVLRGEARVITAGSEAE